MTSATSPWRWRARSRRPRRRQRPRPGAATWTTGVEAALAVAAVLAAASPFPPCGICAKRRHPRRRRRASRSSRLPPTSPRPLRCRPTAGRSSSSPRVRRVPPVAAVAGDNDGAAAGGHRGRHLSVLVARQPVHRLLRRGRAEAARPRRRRAADPGDGRRRVGGGTWSADGVIVFAPSVTSPLMRVSATGGAAAAVTKLGPQQIGPPRAAISARRPTVPVLRERCADTAGIYLGSLDGGAPTRLTPAESAGVSASGPVSPNFRGGCCGCGRERS